MVYRYFFQLLEHSYCLKETPKKKHERIASFFSGDHSYAPVTANTPEKKRKRDFSSPTGKTPTQPLKAKLVKASLINTKLHSYYH